MTIQPTGKLKEWLLAHRPEQAESLVLTDEQQIRLEKFRAESHKAVSYMPPHEREAWAIFCAATHPGHGVRRAPVEQIAVDPPAPQPLPPVLIQPDMAPVQAIVEQTLASASSTAATMEALGKSLNDRVGATESKVSREFEDVKASFAGLTAHLGNVAEAIKSQPAPQVVIPEPPEPKMDYLLWAWRAIILILLAILASRDMRGQVPHDPILVRVSNAGIPLTTRGAGLIEFNCSTNMSCSLSGNRFTMTASSTAGAAWSSITLPTTDLVVDMAAYTTTFTTGTGTSTSNIWTWKDTTGNTGTGYLATFQTVGTSAMKPIRITAKGTTNGVAMDANGILAPIGTGLIIPSAPGPATLGGVKSGQCTTGTDKLMGYDTSGDRICETDQTGGGGSISGLTTGTIPKAASSTTIDDSSLSQDGSTGQITSSKSINDTLTTVSFSATPTFDAALGSKFTITLTNNVTSSTLSNAKTGQNLTFVICQDGTGGRTFAWPTGFSTAPTISGTASVCTSQVFVWSGSVALLSAPATSTDTPTLFGGATRSAPATPAASSLACWFDSTANTQLCKDSSGNVYAVVKTDSGATSNQWVSYINASGVPQKSQPASTNLSDTANLVRNNAANTWNTGAQVFTAASLRAPNSTSVPGTCTVGDVYFDTDASAGQNFFGCTATNTWTLLGDGSATVASGTSPPGTCTTGDLFFDTDATAGQNIYGCTATDTWTLEGDGGGSGGGDFSSNTSTSVDSEVVVFSGTGGKTGKRATGTGVAHLTSGVLSAANVEWSEIATRTKAVPVFSWTAFPSSEAWFEPAAVTFGSNDFHNPMVAVFSGETTNVDSTIYFTFRIPDDFVSGAELCVTWATVSTSGDVYWKWNYNSGSSGSLDLASGSVEQSVHAAATVSGTARNRVRSCQSITDANIAAGDTFQGQLIREASVTVTDTLADKAYVFLPEFGYTGR